MHISMCCNVYAVNVIIYLCRLFGLPGSVKCVMEEGMPTYRNPFQKGNLYVKFEITFPPNKFADETRLKVHVITILYSLVSVCVHTVTHSQFISYSRNP